LTVAGLLVAVVVMGHVDDGPFGRVLAAIRENEQPLFLAMTRGES
jgi:ABC-type branched-subunit amino acid transport system permease subunit